MFHSLAAAMTIDDDLARKIDDFLQQGNSQNDARDMFRISKGLVNIIANGKWKPAKRKKLQEHADAARQKKQKKKKDETASSELTVLPGISLGGCVWVRRGTTDVTQQKEFKSYLPRTTFGKSSLNPILK